MICKTILLAAVSALLFSCGEQVKQELDSDLIATKDGYRLTEKQFKAYLNFLVDEMGETHTFQSQIALKSQLKQEFLHDPTGLLQELELLHEKYTKDDTSRTESASYVAEGHRLIRERLGADIGQMQFETEDANQFRNYLAGSLLRSSSSFYDGGSGGYSYAEVLFCADGSYTESLSGGLTISTPGANAHGRDSDVTPGYWEVASLPNNTLIVLLYSTHPNMLEDSPNGFLPMPIQRFTQQVLYLPGGDYYERIANQCAN